MNFSSSLVFIIGMKHGWNYQEDVLLQETFAKDHLALSLIFEKDYTPEQLEEVQQKLNAIVTGFFKNSDQEGTLSWSPI